VFDNGGIGRRSVEHVDDAADVVAVAPECGHVRRFDVYVREQAHRSGFFRRNVTLASVTERSGTTTEFVDTLLVFGFDGSHLLGVVVIIRECGEDGSRVEVVFSGDGKRVFPGVDNSTLDVENRETRPLDPGITRSNVVVPNDIDHVTR